MKLLYAPAGDRAYRLRDVCKMRQVVQPVQVTRPSRALTTIVHAIKISSKKAKKEVVVGIDLGTTNSAVAYIENGKPRCIPNAEGDRITPSVVTFKPDGDVVVGKQARKLSPSYPTTTYYSVKRVIGRAFEDPLVQEELPRLSFQVCMGA